VSGCTSSPFHPWKKVQTGQTKSTGGHAYALFCNRANFFLSKEPHALALEIP
jgi:hypothetical protein